MRALKNMEGREGSKDYKILAIGKKKRERKGEFGYSSGDGGAEGK